jgi:tetratricopeptide (TPR) repeat protein
MNALAPAVHRAIVGVDVEGFGDRRRTHPDQVAVRDGLYQALERAFTRAGIGWEQCYHEDRGDGALILIPSEVPKTLLAQGVPAELAAAAGDHNLACGQRARIRLRLAMHAGEIHHDQHGVTGTAINTTFRLLEAKPLKQALRGSPGTLAVIASRWFFEEVIRHTPACAPGSWRQVRVSVKETREDAWICLPDAPYPPEPDADPPPSPEVAVPRQLPSAVAGFAGRAAELEALTSLLEEAALPGGTVVISAIDGTAGIGKTALAVQWAHQVADRFPDGQLYVNLRGFDPAGTPMAPAEAVRAFLDALEVPAERIPVSVDAQAALYRSLLAGRRVLVVLDNARDTSQVRPLLPGSAGCSVVVTSRNHLTGLIADGAHPLTVGLFTLADARQMLACRLGTDRLASHPQAVQQIIVRCARLPLALSIVAARAAAHPAFPLTALAEELRDAEGCLQALDAGEAAANVTAVFSWSYQRLSDQAARLFRLLGLHPGPDITASAAASLAAVPVPAARLMLTELARACLLTEHAPGRFTFHDLLRAYATAQARAHGTGAGTDWNAAPQRILDHYLHTAHAAWLLSYPHQQHSITLAPPLPGVTPEEPVDYPAAWAWFTAEYPVLLAAIQLAAATGHHTHAWQLPHTLVPFFERQGHWHDFAATHYTALTATKHHADDQGQAHAHLEIGHACTRIGRLDQARPHLQQALRLFEELGDPAGQSDAHSYLGMTFQIQERHAEALTHNQQAVSLARTGGYLRGLAASLNGLGFIHALRGNAQQALTYCQQSLTLFQDLGDRWSEAAALDSIGYAHHHLGHHQQAASYFEQALGICRELGDLSHQDTVYDHLGDAHHAAGNTAQARHAWQQALNILDQLGDAAVHMGTGYADPDTIRAKLNRCGQTIEHGPWPGG